MSDNRVTSVEINEEASENKDIELTPALEKIQPEVSPKSQLETATLERDAADELNEAIINSKLASGLGNRSRNEPDHEADANRVVQVVEKMGRWLGFNSEEQTENLIEVATVGQDKVLVRPSSIAIHSADGAVKIYQDGTQPQKIKLGRGGWTAVGLIMIFVPIMAILGLLAFNLNQSLDGVSRNLLNVNKQDDFSVGTNLAGAVNNPNTTVVHLISHEGLPQPGVITLYQQPLSNWVLTFSNLQKLDKNQVYVLWFAKKNSVVPTSNAADYLHITNFDPMINSTGATNITSIGIYGDKSSPSDYTAVMVTIERADLVDYTVPSAPFYFSAALPPNHP